MAKERKLFYRQSLEGLTLCGCEKCGWRISTPAVQGEIPGQTAQREFDLHNCEDYPGDEVN
jgi:hypothetical protein